MSLSLRKFLCLSVSVDFSTDGNIFTTDFFLLSNLALIEEKKYI